MAGIYTYQQGASGKAININQFPPEAWSIITGGDSDGNNADLERLFKAVPWLNRGVRILANGMSNLPWVILNSKGEEVDGSEDYQNAAGIWDDPFRDLWLMEASFVLFAKSYWMIERRGRGRMTIPAGLRYFVPHTVTPLQDNERGLVGFERNIQGRPPETFAIDEMLYIWDNDPFQELEPKSSRAIAALAAAGVLANIDEFAADFFKKGMIKTTLLKLSGNPPPAEKERFKAIWGKLMKGAKTAWESLVVNADSVEPVVVGEGIGELGNTKLTSEKREDIATALGVPQSSLFSSAANFAVKEGDKRDLYEEAVIPDSRIIASALNNQYLVPQGYRLQFRPNEMDIFQEDEEDRSGAVVNYINAALVAPPKVTRVVFEMMGVELPGGMEYDEFEKMLAESKESMPEPVAEATQGSLRPVGGTLPEDDGEGKSLMLAEWDAWKRKALKRVKRNRTAATPFKADHIPAELVDLVTVLLEEATTVKRVREIFAAAEG